MKKKKRYGKCLLLLTGAAITAAIMSQPVYAEEKVKTVMEMAEENREKGDGQEEKTEDEETARLEQWIAEADMERQRYPLLDRIEEGEREDYLFLLSSDTRPYRVKEGDTLWGIAEKYYDRGSAWNILKQRNPGITGSGSLIFPDMELALPQIHYMRKQEKSQGGFSSSACTYDIPADWTFGRPEWEVCLEYSYWPEYGDAGVYTHVTDNRMFSGDIKTRWEKMQKQIAESADKTEGVSFHELEFTRYIKEDGTDLLFYSFVCEAGEDRIKCAVAYVPGESYLAEFIGYCPVFEDESAPVYHIEEITRYMAASYVEEGGEKEWDSLKYRPYLGYENWPYEDLHNPFALMEKKYGEEKDAVLQGEDGEIRFESKEWEELIRHKTCFHYGLTEEQEEEFMKRPVYASELAWITEVTFTESPIPGRDRVIVNDIRTVDASCADYNLTTLRDLAVLPNLQKLTLEIGSADDYEELGACLSLTEISITSAEPVTELEWLLKLKKLEALTLNISMFSHLNEIGYEKEGTTTFGDTGEKEEGEEKDGKEEGESISMEDILGQCASLKYLELESQKEIDFGFLDKLPELYTFRLSGEDRESREAELHRAVFGEDDWPQIKCLVIDDSWLRNPG